MRWAGYRIGNKLIRLISKFLQTVKKENAMKIKAVIKRDKDGDILEFHISAAESNTDWLRSARLKRKNDKQAREELEKTDNNYMERE